MNANQNAKPANAVALSELTRLGVGRLDLASLFDNAPALLVPVAAQKRPERDGKIITLARSVRRLAPAA